MASQPFVEGRVWEKVGSLKPIRAFSRSLARASFASVLTLAAALLGLLLSFIFTAFYFNQANEAYNFSAHENGVQVARHTLAGRAEILSPAGGVLHGSMTDKARARADSYPLVHEGETVGTLTYAPSAVFDPPIAYWLAALICFGVAFLSGMTMRLFALTVVDYVGQVTRLVGDYSLVDDNRQKVSKFAFAEFRQLALATTRATRRVSKELETLRATARLDERTGLINEPAFLDELKLAMQTLVPGVQTVLVTIEVQPQNQHADTIGLSLPSEAYAMVSERLRMFASQAAMKHGHLPSEWILGS